MIIARPASEFGPLQRLELAAGEFQRPFRRGAAGDNAHDRAKKARDQRTPKGLRTRPTVPHANKCMADGNGSAARASMLATVNQLPRRRAGRVMLPLRCAAPRRRYRARPAELLIRTARLSPSAAYCIGRSSRHLFGSTSPIARFVGVVLIEAGVHARFSGGLL